MDVKAVEIDGTSGVVAELRGVAAELLKSGRVSVVIGYARGWDPARAVPYFARSPEQAANLVFDETCAVSLVKYALECDGGASDSNRVAVVLKGCDSLGLQRLIMDRRIERRWVYGIGLRCSGPVTPRKCDGCTNVEPVGCDVVLGEPAPMQPREPGEPLRPEVPETMSSDERYQFWSRQLQRCIRCYACRNICPACHCRECSLDPEASPWLTRERTLSEQAMYHFARAFHVAGRCTGCGECERVCPVGVPLMDINRKVMRDISVLFGIERPEVPVETEPLGRYSQDDPEEFM